MGNNNAQTPGGKQTESNTPQQQGGPLKQDSHLEQGAQKQAAEKRDQGGQQQAGRPQEGDQRQGQQQDMQAGKKRDQGGQDQENPARTQNDGAAGAQVPPGKSNEGNQRGAGTSPSGR